MHPQRVIAKMFIPCTLFLIGTAKANLAFTCSRAPAAGSYTDVAGKLWEPNLMRNKTGRYPFDKGSNLRT